jgi:hypothetical protein
MGWRAWDAYERDAEARRRALPWHAGLLPFALIVALAVALIWTKN